MSEDFYRFRSTHALLDGFHELENQQIYFCPYRELNDPLEGLKDVFWKGDEIIWSNLLHHYLHCLTMATSLTSVMGNEFSPTMCEALVYQIPDDLPEAPIRQICTEIRKEFFDDEMPQALIKALSQQVRAIRRDELIFYLRLIHPLSLATVIEHFSKHGLGIVQSTEALNKLVKATEEALRKILASRDQAVEMPDVYFVASENIQSQLHLMEELNRPVNDPRHHWTFVARDFPAYYVNALERLIYPDWYTACFVTDPKDASMWGAYGDGHRGVCLKFKSSPGSGGGRTLDLYRAIGVSAGKNQATTTNYDYVPHRFEEVQYSGKFPEIHFFESLGTLPRFKLDNFWYVGEGGKLSATASGILSESNEWRSNYWQRFGAGYITKSPEWAHEGEYRLAVYSSLFRFDTIEDCRLKYRFSDLTGIVFGIRTNVEEKAKIIRIIQKKCAAEGRSNFEFYQAHYSMLSRKIELAPLGLLKS